MSTANENLSTLQEVVARVVTLEAAVAALTAETKGGKISNDPRGAFASLGGIEISPACSSEGSQGADLSELYGDTGKRVR
jgi:hypothetical protein